MNTTSASNTDKLMADLRLVVTDAEELLRATADHAGEGAAELRTKAESTLACARERLLKMQETILSQGKAVSQHADQYVREHPWGAIGIAAAVGLVIGALASRR